MTFHVLTKSANKKLYFCRAGILPSFAFKFFFKKCDIMGKMWPKSNFLKRENQLFSYRLCLLLSCFFLLSKPRQRHGDGEVLSHLIKEKQITRSFQLNQQYQLSKLHQYTEILFVDWLCEGEHAASAARLPIECVLNCNVRLLVASSFKLIQEAIMCKQREQVVTNPNNSIKLGQPQSEMLMKLTPPF